MPLTDVAPLQATIDIAAPPRIVCGKFLVQPQLLFEIVIRTAAPYRAPNPRDDFAQPLHASSLNLPCRAAGSP